MHYKLMNSYGHPTGTKEIKKLNEEVKNEQTLQQSLINETYEGKK
jgi:hypothetical protein